MFYYPLTGIWSLFAFITFIIVYMGMRQEKKRLLHNAKVDFLRHPEAKAYIDEGYEIKKFEPIGDGEYSIELVLKQSKDATK